MYPLYKHGKQTKAKLKFQIMLVSITCTRYNQSAKGSL